MARRPISHSRKDLWDAAVHLRGKHRAGRLQALRFANLLLRALIAREIVVAVKQESELNWMKPHRERCESRGHGGGEDGLAPAQSP